MHTSKQAVCMDAWPCNCLQVALMHTPRTLGEAGVDYYCISCPGGLLLHPVQRGTVGRVQG